MRVLVISDQWFPEFRGGAARFAAEAYSRIAGAGHEVCALVPVHPDLPAREKRGRLTLVRCLPRSALPQTVTDVWASWRFSRRFRGQVDVVVAHQASGAVGAIAARLGAPLVFVWHGPAAREAVYRSRLHPSRAGALRAKALRPLLGFLERAAVRRAASITVRSEASRGLLACLHPAVADKIEIVSGGVDTERFSPGDGGAAARARIGLELDARVLLMPRRLEPQLNVEGLLRALAQIPASERPQLVVAGEGSLEGHLRRVTTLLGIGDSVTFAGTLDDEALTDWYRAADLVVIPTLEHEGFGLAAGEALACGTPVLGTPVGALPEILAPLDERLITKGTDVQSLRAGISEGLALATPELQSRSAEYAASRFGWARSLPEWERVLLRAAGRGASEAVEAGSRARQDAWQT